jgi:hypothetical protein
VRPGFQPLARAPLGDGRQPATALRRAEAPRPPARTTGPPPHSETCYAPRRNAELRLPAPGVASSRGHRGPGREIRPHRSQHRHLEAPRSSPSEAVAEHLPRCVACLGRFRADLNDCLQETAFVQSVPRARRRQARPAPSSAATSAAHGDDLPPGRRPPAPPRRLRRRHLDAPHPRGKKPRATPHLHAPRRAHRSPLLLGGLRPRHCRPRSRHQRPLRGPRQPSSNRSSRATPLKHRGPARRDRGGAQEARAKPSASSATSAGRARAPQGRGRHRPPQALSLNERETRRKLIDALLKSTRAGTSARTARAPTRSAKRSSSTKVPEEGGGAGYADYVLWGDDGKPLAVIEAKRAAKDMENGPRPGVDLRPGPRAPVRPTPAHPLHERPGDRALGRRRPAGLGHRQRDARQAPPLQPSTPSDSLLETPRQAPAESPSRPSPIHQGHRRSPLPDRGHPAHLPSACTRAARKALWVLATGTGKTRVAVAFTRPARSAPGGSERVLFLCDRKELRKASLWQPLARASCPDAARVLVTSALTAGRQDQRPRLLWPRTPP